MFSGADDMLDLALRSSSVELERKPCQVSDIRNGGQLLGLLFNRYTVARGLTASAFMRGLTPWVWRRGWMS